MSGNDYAPNIGRISFATIRKAVKESPIKAVFADDLMHNVIDGLAKVRDIQRNCFDIALDQFCVPTVSYSEDRKNVRPDVQAQQVSNDTLQQADGVQNIQKLLTPNLSAPRTGSWYTFVKSTLISKTNTCEENKGKLSRRRQPPMKLSAGSKRKKQKKGSDKQEESSKHKEDPERPSYDDPNTGEEIQLHEMTRATSAWTCGLYSSFLAAATTRFTSQQ
ncbi:hypothetical protein DFQ30_000856 [Apophysomyces sp. BC1015]|nr:hypothetical protein DFQ30_000856 [Apophysomyces sp. BC1015]